MDTDSDKINQKTHTGTTSIVFVIGSCIEPIIFVEENGFIEPKWDYQGTQWHGSMPKKFANSNVNMMFVSMVQNLQQSELSWSKWTAG